MKTGIFIDDTGTPSQKSKSKYDTGDWKTWVAVILNPNDRKEIENILNELCEALENELKIKEFHFTHIFSGKGVFRKIELEKRLQIFSLFGEIYKKFNSPIIVQSLTSDDIIRNKMQFLKYFKPDGFNFEKNSDLALWFLLEKCAKFLKENSLPLPAEFFVDSGRQKPNTTQIVNIVKEVTENSIITYASSEQNPMIQFIDFIAFSINRMRWILMNEKKSELDLALLNLISEIDFNVTNLTKVAISPTDFKVSEYDKNLRKKYDENGNLSDELVEKIRTEKK
tara:strand:- start:1412 stop:2257 length:846 start_codon:yes stop_codon:yes gene_type:complete